MEVTVSQEQCISCGMCIDICPEVFSYNDESKSVAIDGKIPKELEDGAVESANQCPVDAISIIE